MMTSLKYNFQFLLAILLLITAVQPIAADTSYDPISRSVQFTYEIIDLIVHDTERNRDIPIRVYLSSKTTPEPVILFSHGLGGSREGSTYLGKHWASCGYVSVFLQHPGSDDAIWKDKPKTQRLIAMRNAASEKNFMLRLKDVPVVIDQLEKWNRNHNHILSGRMNLQTVGMSGHSFGAVTTQALSGQSKARGNSLSPDPRIDAAVIMSPSSPRRGSPQTAFGKVTLPWLLMTGTRDIAPTGSVNMESRLSVFRTLPQGHKYELVLHDAGHSAFTERFLPADKNQRNPNHHRAILALTTAFWDTYLRSDAAAREWLLGDGPESVLEKNDLWHLK